MDLHDELRRVSRDWERLRKQACRGGFSKYDPQVLAIAPVIRELESQMARLLTILYEESR